jgi:hypothetical protein
MTAMEQPGLPSSSPKGPARSVLVAVAVLLVMMGGMYLMRVVSQEAVVEVQADEATAAVLSVREVLLVRSDGPERFPLRAGRQSIKAGHYRIEVPPHPEAATLEFSSGPTFAVKMGGRITITVSIKPRQP